MGVVIHEAAHVLGMSSNLYQYFWDPETSKPRTIGGFTSQPVKCVDDIERTLVMPYENTLVGIHHVCSYLTIHHSLFLCDNCSFRCSCSSNVPLINIKNHALIDMIYFLN